MKRRTVADPDLSLREVLAEWPETAPVFLRHEMLCVGCLIVPFHSIADACREYGLDEALFHAELEQAINS